MDREIKQVDAVLGVAAAQTAQVGRVVDWLDHYVTVIPKLIPGDFTQIYAWLVPQCQDARTKDLCKR